MSGHRRDLAVARRMLAAIDESVVDEVRRWPAGTVLLTPSLPSVWDANYLLLERRDEPAAALAAATDAVFRGAGVADTTIVVEDESPAAQVGPDLRELGFELTRFVLMRLRTTPPAPEHDVVEASFADVAPSRRELTLEAFPGDHELADQLAELDRRLERMAGGRWFAVRGEGEILARAWLRERDGIGQVEDVATSRAARRRGLGRAVVAAAARTSIAAGNRLTFVVADAGATTPRFYEKLGFEAMGLTHRFVRKLR